MTYLKNIGLIALGLVLGIAVMSLLGPTGVLGALNMTTIGNPVKYTGTVQIGPLGATITELKASNCNLSNADASIAATSTGYVYCSITGVASGDVVMAQLATTSANVLFGGWVIQSAKASTTAGMVDIRLTNNTGIAAVPSVSAVGSSTNIWYMDN